MTEIFVGELCSSALVWDYSTIKSRKIRMFQRALRIEYAHDLMLLHGEVQPTLNKHRPYLQRLDQQSQLYVVGLIMENPALYLAEI